MAEERDYPRVLARNENGEVGDWPIGHIYVKPVEGKISDVSSLLSSDSSMWCYVKEGRRFVVSPDLTSIRQVGCLQEAFTILKMKREDLLPDAPRWMEELFG